MHIYLEVECANKHIITKGNTILELIRVLANHYNSIKSHFHNLFSSYTVAVLVLFVLVSPSATYSAGTCEAEHDYNNTIYLL